MQSPSLWGFPLSALGRKLPVRLTNNPILERPLSGKADIQNLAVEICALRDRFTPGSRH